MERFLAIDGNNLLIRAMRAMEGHELEDGLVATGAVVAFIQSVARCTREYEPTHIEVCWDAGHAYRSMIYPEYKGGRTSQNHFPREGGLHDPFVFAMEALDVMGIGHLFMPGLEADDLIAHFWREWDGVEGRHMRIVSGDKDLLQLVSPNVEQLRPPASVWTAEEIEAKYGCPPEHFGSVLALTGDKGDGVPGIYGVGYKRASKLLYAYDWSLRRLLDSDAKKIQGMREQVLLSLALVNLRDHSSNVTFEARPFAPPQPGQPSGDRFIEFLDAHLLVLIKNRFERGELF